MELILTNREEKRLREIISKQNEVKKAALIRRNLRIMNKLAKKSGGPTPVLKRGVRIKDKHVLQILLGTLSDRNLARYNAQGVTREMAKEIIETRPALLAKYQALVLGLTPIGG